MDFKKRIYAKWILSGEHSVLRSKPALVFPLTHYYIDFSYTDTEEPLSIKHSGQDQSGLDFSFSPLFEEALALVNKKRKDLKGVIYIDSQVPFGAGLGSSAILSVACALLFQHKSWIQKEDLKEIAKKLEDLFHKQSSGIDVAAVLEGKPLLFQGGEIQKYLEPSKLKPFLYLSYSGRRSSTFFSISKVEKFFKGQRQDDLAKIDEKMARSVELCLSAMMSEDRESMMKKLQEGLSLGEDCFRQFSLLSYDLESHSQKLKEAGALATKPTGSGLGGYVISLWDREVPKNLGIEFKPVSL